MFKRVMLHPRICRRVVERILGRPIGKIRILEAEKTAKEAYLAKGIRMDVYLKDDHSHYDIEMQTTQQAAISKRARYYQSAMDMESLHPNETYLDLKDGCVIFICQNDPFDRNLARYTMKERCLEAPDLMPDDGTKKIFLYTFGDSRGESPEMVRFLKYLQNSSNTAGDTLLEDISKTVQYEKQSPRAKEAYRMYSLWYNDTYAKGMKEGEAKGEARGLAKGEARGSAKRDITFVLRMLLKDRSVSEIAEDLSLDIEEVRSIEEAMEALHITCVNDETVERVYTALAKETEAPDPDADRIA